MSPIKCKRAGIILAALMILAGGAREAFAQEAAAPAAEEEALAGEEEALGEEEEAEEEGWRARRASFDNPSAQAGQMAVGGGPEWNMNSRLNFAGGLLAGFDYNFLAPIAAGVSIGTSYNFSLKRTKILVLEPEGTFRWYFLGTGHTGPFAQAGLGAHLLFDEGELETRFLAEFRTGWRFAIGKRLYVEPYLRAGHPFAFGFGAVAGVRFGGKAEEPPPPPLPPPPPPVAAVLVPVEDVGEDVDTSPPELQVSLLPRPFSPDGDGVDDELSINVGVASASEVTGWHIEIREPVPPYNLFREWKGEGKPPGTLKWDGRSLSGELVQSASSYHFGLTVSNLYNYAIYQGTVDVDILVQHDGEAMRIIVPSIVFAPNSGEFIRGLDEETAANNEAILQRIAEILNKAEFNTYRIRVEGHANPVTAPGTLARNNEERGTRSEKGLLPLSEERARAVVNYLAELGVDAVRLTPVGAGASRTVAAVNDRDNWWKNRRVEFILESKADEEESEGE